tara:strand:- start:414 stop:1115 length:702 start_codon:yes stop_codon:yes gene_type:complete
MVGSSIGSSIGKPIGFNIDGSTASGGGGGGTTVTYDVLTSTASPNANQDCAVFRATQYYDNTPPTSYDDMQFNNNEHKIGLDYSSWSNRYRFYQAYFRFVSVALEQGATIESAYLKVQFHSGSERAFRINGFDVDNQAQPAVSNNGSEGAHSNHTTASVDWTVTALGSGEEVATSPNIKTIVQEIVDRSGWSSGNALMLGVWMPSTQSADYFRTFNTGKDSNDTKPQLEITYS